MGGYRCCWFANERVGKERRTIALFRHVEMRPHSHTVARPGRGVGNSNPRQPSVVASFGSRKHHPCDLTAQRRGRRRVCLRTPFPFAWFRYVWKCVCCGWWERGSAHEVWSRCLVCWHKRSVRWWGWWSTECQIVDLVCEGKDVGVLGGHIFRLRTLNGVSMMTWEKRWHLHT